MHIFLHKTGTIGPAFRYYPPTPISRNSLIHKGLAHKNAANERSFNMFSM